MGIKSLSEFLGCAKPCKYKDIQGKRLAIDAYPELFRTFGMQYASGLTNAAGEPTQHIKSILTNIFRRRANRITETWCIDGRPPPEKKDTNKERKDIRDEAHSKMEALAAEIAELENMVKNMTPEAIRAVDPDFDKTMEAKRLQLKTLSARNPTTSRFNKYVQDLVFILESLGIPYATAPDGIDSEKLCADLTNMDLADIVQTVDMDALPYGARAVLKKVPKKTGVYDLYVLSECLEGKKISMHDFVEVCVALGSDFAPGVPGCGPVTVVKKIGKFNFDEKQKAAVSVFEQKLQTAVQIVKPVESAESRAKLRKWLIDVQGFGKDGLDALGLVESGEVVAPTFKDMKSSSRIKKIAGAAAPAAGAIAATAPRDMSDVFPESKRRH